MAESVVEEAKKYFREGTLGARVVEALAREKDKKYHDALDVLRLMRKHGILFEDIFPPRSGRVEHALLLAKLAGFVEMRTYMGRRMFRLAQRYR